MGANLFRDIAGECEWLLVVDDNPMIARVLNRALTTLGHNVLTCTNSMEALKLFEASPQAIAAVITDQSMPELKGLDMARAMLQIKPGLPVVLCTGLDVDVDEATALSAGIRGYLLKPFSVKALDTVIRRLLEEEHEASSVNVASGHIAGAPQGRWIGDRVQESGV